MKTTPPLPPLKIKPVAHAYSRFSTKDQALGDSERRQKDKAQAWADINGYELKHLHDPGISAFHGKNQVIGQFNLFLSSVRARQFGPNPVLLVENLDRVSREIIEEAQSLFLELINLGAVIITLHNGKRYAKGMGLVDIITALVEMDVAHQHSAKLSMRVKEAVEARRRAGGIIHNRSSCPHWLQIDAKRTKFEPIPERVTVVRDIFNRAAKGQGGEAIARAFNARKLPTWTKAKYWRGTTVHDIMHNRAVLGEYQGKPGYFGDPIITASQWAVVNDRTTRAAQGRGNGVVKELNLFTGFIFSGLDGSRLILRQSGVKSRKTGQYVWHPYLVSAATIAGQSANSHRVRYQLVEGRMIWLMDNLDNDLLTRARTGAHDDTHERIATTEQQIQGIEKQVTKLTRLILGDDSPSPSLVAELKNQEADLVAAKAGLEAVKVASAKVCALPDLPNDGEAMAQPETRRAFRKDIARWCNKIEVFGDYLICWLSERYGIKLNLLGSPMAEYYDLDHIAVLEQEKTRAELLAS